MYEVNHQQLPTLLSANANISTFTDNAIVSLLTALSGESISFNVVKAPSDTSNSADFHVIQGNGSKEALKLDFKGGSAFVSETDQDIDATFNTVERVIVSGGGNDKYIVNGDRNTTLDGGAGNDTLTTSGGNDYIIGGAGNDSISAGAGNDTIVSGVGNDTIDGGSGRDTVSFAGNRSDYKASVVNGKLVVADSSNSSQISNVEFLSFNNKGSIAVASNAEQATVLRLYKGILNRDADKGGTDYWVNIHDTDKASVVGIANAFLMSSELNAKGTLTNEQFLDAMYSNTFGRSADAGGKAYWLNALANGQERAHIAINIVGSEEAASTVDNVILITGSI